MSTNRRALIDDIRSRKYVERIRALVEEQKKNPLPFGSSCRGCDGKTFCLFKPRVMREGKVLCVTHALHWEERKR